MTGDHPNVGHTGLARVVSSMAKTPCAFLTKGADLSRQFVRIGSQL